MTKNSSLGFNRWFLKWQSSSIRGLQILLTVVILVTLSTGVYRYQKTLIKTKQPKNVLNDGSQNTQATFTQEVKPLSFYSDLVDSRDLFRFNSEPSDVTVVANGPATTAGMGFSARYLVQGIVFDKNPQAIIKDTQSAKTYFLHREEMLDGAKLVDINGNIVTFNLAGEKVELLKK